MDFKKETAKFLADSLDIDIELISEIIEVPPQRDMGDFAIPCFRFAKELKKAPVGIAADFIETLESKEKLNFINRIEAKGPYLNVFLDRGVFASDLINDVLTNRGEFLKSNSGNNETVLVEFSSPNIAKPFHVGHGFSTILGDVLANIYASQGYNVERLNHLGDYGTQFGKLIVAYDNWGDEASLTDDPIKELTRVYVKFHEEAEFNPELEDEARLRFRNLELGYEHEYGLWEKFRAYSVEQFKETYDRMGIRFDSYKGEAFYVDRLDEVVNTLTDAGIVSESEGALIVDLEDENMPPALIRKSDGSSIYATRDLAAAMYRKEHYDFDKLIYVVGLPQSLHFKQVFTVLKKAGFDWSDDCYFVGFGLVKLPDGVGLSTRSGDVVYLEDLLSESVKKTKEIIIKNNEKREDKMLDSEIDETAEIIGQAALRYTYLRNSRERDIIFDWDEVLDFEGDSAPYMLYAYARARSILRRSGLTAEEVTSADLTLLDSQEEFDLVNEISTLKSTIDYTLRNNEPSSFARQLMSLCRTFSKFYNSVSILQAESEELKIARLALASAFANVAKEALALLGMETAERM